MLVLTISILLYFISVVILILIIKSRRFKSKLKWIDTDLYPTTQNEDYEIWSSEKEEGEENNVPLIYLFMIKKPKK